jgi:alkylresorcinol/alkylpyrone synthase
MIGPRIGAVATALPSHVVSQEMARSTCEKVYAGHPELRRLLKVFKSSGVRMRHFAFPPETYLEDRPFEERNDAYIEQALSLAGRAIRACLRQAGLEALQIDHLIVVTTTGLATPSLDALLGPALGFHPQCRRWPIFGLGCAGGAGALSRAADLARQDPEARVLVVAVELCGQVFSSRGLGPVDVVGSSLFGDGAAAAIVTGARASRGGPRILGTRADLFPGTAHLMGWKFTGDGMRLHLSQEIPGAIRGPFQAALRSFLREQEVHQEDIGTWILHPGGSRILETYQDALGLAPADLEPSRESLARVGNLASASVLFVLRDVLEAGRPAPGGKALLAAVGPGFGSEMLLLEG